MSKWRPTDNCLYVIPDIHGAVELLQKICDRILPLRKEDKLILLGDYIDRHRDSHKVVDYLIELKKEYGSQIVMLMGNHEHMLLKSCNLMNGKKYSLQDSLFTYKMWTANGGFETIYGYMERKNIVEPLPWEFNRSRVCDLIPQEHIEFFNNLANYYEFENYSFVHAGCHPDIPLNEHEPEQLWWDRKLHNYAKGNMPIDWDRTIITGHNGPNPFVHEKYMMLDAGSPERLLVAELRSMEAFMAMPGNKRLVKFQLKDS